MQIIRKSMKQTKKREQILETLQKHHGCISARDLATKLQDIDQATVYRNLDLFVKEGLIKKFVFDGSEMMYEYAEPNHHHAVCDDCERVMHVEINDKKILETINVKGFDVSSVEVLVRGSCAKK